MCIISSIWQLSKHGLKMIRTYPRSMQLELRFRSKLFDFRIGIARSNLAGDYLNYYLVVGLSLFSVQFSRSVALCHPMNRNMPGLPVHHQLPESTQTHVHQISDAIQPSHPLSPLLLLPSVLPSITVLPSFKVLKAHLIALLLYARLHINIYTYPLTHKAAEQIDELEEVQGK